MTTSLNKNIMAYTRIKNKAIHFTASGKGGTIVFSWIYRRPQDMETFLGKTLEALQGDLHRPPAMKKRMYCRNHTMELMADTISAMLKQLKVKKCLMIGHSWEDTSLLLLPRIPGMLKGSGFSIPLLRRFPRINETGPTIEVVKKTASASFHCSSPDFFRWSTPEISKR